MSTHNCSRVKLDLVFGVHGCKTALMKSYEVFLMYYFGELKHRELCRGIKEEYRRKLIDIISNDLFNKVETQRIACGY